VAERFDHFTHSLGLPSPRCESWESPFDYEKNCLLYLPSGLPEPSERIYTQKVVEAAIPILKASRGRAFMLFTSHAALNLASQILAERLSYPLYVQGERPKSQLLEAFKTSMNGILLGTQTFWEGVDVQGPALSLVIIDKLPFASPGDPVLAARLESLRKRGVNPFSAHQLPEAIINLKQGVGRLIRDAKDCGVLMLCDPRLTSKPYGRLFLKSLPVIPTTQDPAKAIAFFHPDPI
jgi:ATP-dependent DNA helicase DinG